MSRLFAILMVLGSFLAGMALYRSGMLTEQDRLSGPQTMRSDSVGGLIGKYRPAFSFVDVEGRRGDNSEWDGKIVVLNFWATWCPPCLEEIPILMALHAQYSQQQVQFVGLALQEASAILDYRRQLGISYPLLAGSAAMLRLAKRYGNVHGTLPYTVVINQAGQIVLQKQGALTQAQLERIILSLLTDKTVVDSLI